MVNFPFRISQVLSVWRRAQRRNRSVQISTRGFRAAHGAVAGIDWLRAAPMVNFPFRISQVRVRRRRAERRTGIYKSVYEDFEHRTVASGACLRNSEGKILVGDTRFELVTSAMSRQRSNQLS